MSRKQAAKSRPGSGGRRAEAERKRDERAARRALAKERRNRPEPGSSGCEEEFQLPVQSAGRPVGGPFSEPSEAPTGDRGLHDKAA
ncbi:similar to novel protein (predicted), isoform CRA_d [Rattus norvegicus]|uniref:Similar to novel protein (Predicted), isoform CRA_d n=1 Tax=Rattus norvegicus TaxID=10116 RepID=A6ITJ6_RAT|nr:similar to novel protein (predicted), isoform CRA_d [Rattus norvegicus]